MDEKTKKHEEQGESVETPIETPEDVFEERAYYSDISTNLGDEPEEEEPGLASAEKKRKPDEKKAA